jgi:hypothetical protein
VNLSLNRNDSVVVYFPDPNTSIELEYDLPFQINFKAICLTAGKKVKYMYRLIGLSDEWQPEQDYAADFVRYPTLSPGNYTFQVTGCNDQGIWNENPAEIIFTILPPWYRTWWAYSSYAILGFGSIFGFIRMRTKQLEKEKRKLEHTVKVRTAEIEKQKHLIEEKQREIIDSIKYAQRIQNALITSEKYIIRSIDRLRGN